MRVCLFIGMFLLLYVSSLAPSQAEPPAGGQPEAGKNSAQTETKLQKIEVEVSKLQEQISSLSSPSKLLLPFVAAAGAILAALIPVLFARYQRKKLKQDLTLDREKHILEVFRDLGSQEPRIRIGAVATLVQRIDRIRTATDQKKAKKDEEDIDEEQRLPTIVSVLISVTKHERQEEIQKYIADGLADALDALVDQKAKDCPQEPKKPKSPLENYDFQGAQLRNAWWKRIDARGVDFYGANLARAGLREAFLCGAVFRRADLTQAALNNAKLGGADLQETQLLQARLTRAILTKANLKRACLRGADLTGADLSGADLSGADLNGADLTDADLSNAKLDKADLRNARLRGTRLEGVQFGRANLHNVDLRSVKGWIFPH